MQISVIIPTHNRAHTLPRALDSVIKQSSSPLEIILVDDGSSDNTSTLIRQDYPDVHYLHQPNQGVSAARNLGISESKGEWLAFLDSDDEWLADKLKTQQALLQTDPQLRLCHTEEIWIRNGKRVNAMKKHAKSGGRIYLNCLPLCVISPSSVIIHRSLFDELGLFDETLPACEDYDLWLRICAGEAVGFVEQPQILKYGGHDDQLSRLHWGMDRFRAMALEKRVNDPRLTLEEQIATRMQLNQKYQVLALGAEKRGKLTDANAYREKIINIDHIR